MNDSAVGDRPDGVGEVPEPGPARLRFGENVERLREDLGLSTEELAERSLIGAEELRRMVAGEQRVFLAELLRIAEALGVGVDLLMEGIVWSSPSEGGVGFEVVDADRGGRDG